MFRPPVIKHRREDADGGQTAAVLAGLDQAVDRKSVSRGRNHPVKVRRFRQAAAAHAWRCQRMGAGGAAWSTEPGQFPPAGFADAAGGRPFVAEQTVGGKNAVGRTPPSVK